MAKKTRKSAELEVKAATRARLLRILGEADLDRISALARTFEPESASLDDFRFIARVVEKLQIDAEIDALILEACSCEDPHG